MDSKKHKNGAHYIMNVECLKNDVFNKKGYILDDCTNIHSEEDLKQTLENSKVHKPKISLISIENTHLASGGVLFPLIKSNQFLL